MSAGMGAAVGGAIGTLLGWMGGAIVMGPEDDESEDRAVHLVRQTYPNMSVADARTEVARSRTAVLGGSATLGALLGAIIGASLGSPACPAPAPVVSKS